MDLVQEQLLMEAESVERGVSRYFETLGASVERDREFDNSTVSSLIREPLHNLEKGVRKLQVEARARLVEAQTTGMRLGGWEPLVLALDSHKLAYIAFKTVLVAGRGEYRVQRAAQTIGRMVNYEVRWEQLRETERDASKEREYDPPNRIAQLKRTVTEINPRSLRMWLKKLDDIPTTEWSKKEHFVLGSAVLNVMLSVCPEVVERVTIRSIRFSTRMDMVLIKLTATFSDELKSRHADEAMNKPWWRPMVCPPKDWRRVDGKYCGGYLKNEPNSSGGFRVEQIIKEIRFKHTSNSEANMSPELLEALNKVQSTRWKINTAVLARACTAIEHTVGPVPYETPMEMPASVPADVWAKMSKGQRGEVKAKREAVHTHNNRTASKTLSARRVLNVAEELADKEAIFFPHNLDWRGRAYPMPQDLHPQADDFAKSMLTFAEGKPLGEHGLKWLVFHLANCFGMDKVDRQGQADWYNEHMGDIYKVATDPFHQGLEFWKQADEPWQFLAACIEVCLAGGDPTYVSHLPVHVDGSCNGLQHLSAMGLDPVGAKAVNLMPGPRQDIYQIVADKVNRQVDKDVYSYDGIDLQGDTPDKVVKAASAAWQGRVSRKTVKRGVMTTPYGLTSIGMRDQLLKDRWCDDLEGDRMQNANYLRDRMKEAIDGTIVKGTEIMAWFQDCAEILAESNKGISWTTPVGLRVTQRYTGIPGKRVTTLLGRYIFEEHPTDDVATRKQKLSIAPNIIHSFDAAHMMLSVLAAPEGYSFSVIHDSFGCHAADMEEFGHVIREQFVEIYKTDWFATMTVDLEDQGVVHVPKAPARGDFDIEQVLDAEFFFA